MALQLIHKAALCSSGLRRRRSLSQRRFELANGLPFVASDVAIHNLLAVCWFIPNKSLSLLPFSEPGPNLGLG